MQNDENYSSLFFSFYNCCLQMLNAFMDGEWCSLKMMKAYSIRRVKQEAGKKQKLSESNKRKLYDYGVISSTYESS